MAARADSGLVRGVPEAHESVRPEGPRILIADDDPIIVDALSMFLRRDGYEVDSCRDGSEAIEMLAAGHYALVITDVNMPRTNGLELLRTVRRHYPGVVVIVVTGYGTI